MTFPLCLSPRTRAVAAPAPSTSGSRRVVMVTTDETVWSVPAASALPAVTVVNVTRVTLVTVPVPVTQASGVWPVSCAVMASMDPPVKPATVQNTGHVTPDEKVQVPASVRPVGLESAVRPSKLRSSSVLRPVRQKPSVGKTTPVCAGPFTKETGSPVQWWTCVRSGTVGVLKEPSVLRKESR